MGDTGVAECVVFSTYKTLDQIACEIIQVEATSLLGLTPA